MAGCGREEELVSQEEGSIFGKKYGGLVRKKKPLISKDNERAFFDSADWALGKDYSKEPAWDRNPKRWWSPYAQSYSEPLVNSFHQGDPLVVLEGIVSCMLQQMQ